MVEKIKDLRLKRLFKYTGTFIVFCTVAYLFQLVWTFDKSINAFYAFIFCTAISAVFYFIIDIFIFLRTNVLSWKSTVYKKNRKDLYHQYVLNHFFHINEIRLITDKQEVEGEELAEIKRNNPTMALGVLKNIDLFKQVSKAAEQSVFNRFNNYLNVRAHKMKLEAIYKRQGGKGNSIRDYYKRVDKKQARKVMVGYHKALRAYYKMIFYNKIMYDKQILRVINNKLSYRAKEMPYNTTLRKEYYKVDYFRLKRGKYILIHDLQELKSDNKVKERYWFNYRSINLIVNLIVRAMRDNNILTALSVIRYKRTNRTMLETIINIILFIPISIMHYITEFIRSAYIILDFYFRPMWTVYKVYSEHRRFNLDSYTEEELLKHKDKEIVIKSLDKVKLIDYRYFTLQKERVLALLPVTHKPYYIRDQIIVDLKQIGNKLLIKARRFFGILDRVSFHILRIPHYLIVYTPQLPELSKKALNYTRKGVWVYLTETIPGAIIDIKNIIKNKIIKTKNNTKNKIKKFKEDYPYLTNQMSKIKNYLSIVNKCKFSRIKKWTYKPKDK